MALLLAALILLTSAVAGRADVYFVEEIVNRGFGSRRIGARKTTNQVYIKGGRQKIETQIEASRKTAAALRRQGQPLRSSTILRLDTDQVYEIDRDAQTFVQEKIPAAAKKAVPRPSSPKPGGPRIDFALKETGDTTRIAGVRCRRVVAQMRARYFDSKTRKPRRENRYTYDAWVAEDFPGYEEIQAFQRLQAAKTSYPSLISGGLAQLRETVEDYEQLNAELDALEGFVMRSTLRVSVARSGRKRRTPVFRLDREIRSLVYSPLPDSVFNVSPTLTKIEKR